MHTRKEAFAAKGFQGAEKYFTAALRLGGALNRDPDCMLIVRITGIVVQQIAVREMTRLYKEMGEGEKLKAVEGRSRQLKEQFEQIKRSMAG